jgi:DnaK suppressor protein
MADLTQQQRDEIRELLERRDHELREEVRAQRAVPDAPTLQEFAGPVGDSADQSVASLMEDLNLAAVNRDARELQEIADAHRRLEDGSYGECMRCGREIDYRRLRAYPTAARCIDCQSLHEKVYSGSRTPSL